MVAEANEVAGVVVDEVIDEDWDGATNITILAWHDNTSKVVDEVAHEALGQTCRQIHDQTHPCGRSHVHMLIVIR